MGLISPEKQKKKNYRPKHLRVKIARGSSGAKIYFSNVIIAAISAWIAYCNAIDKPRAEREREGKSARGEISIRIRRFIWILTIIFYAITGK